MKGKSGNRRRGGRVPAALSGFEERGREGPRDAARIATEPVLHLEPAPSPTYSVPLPLRISNGTPSLQDGLGRVSSL